MPRSRGWSTACWRQVFDTQGKQLYIETMIFFLQFSPSAMIIHNVKVFNSKFIWVEHCQAMKMQAFRLGYRISRFLLRPLEASPLLSSQRQKGFISQCCSDSKNSGCVSMVCICPCMLLSTQNAKYLWLTRPKFEELSRILEPLRRVKDADLYLR